MKPSIYFSYGMTKSGSTFSFELARTALEMSGHDQSKLSGAIVAPNKRLNFCNDIDADMAAAIRSEVAQRGCMVAIKTHARPAPEVIEMLCSNEAIAHAVYRDPRDVALSMLDHGTMARKKGKLAFSEYHEIADTIENLRHQSNTLLAWLSLPNVKPVYYDDVAFKTRETLEQLTAEIGIAAPLDAVIDKVTHDRFTQRNKAIRARHTQEMDAATSAKFRAIFAPLYERLIEGRQSLPRDGQPLLDPAEPLCDWHIDFAT